MILRKFKATTSDVLFYLEEVIQMNMASELEEDLYYTYKETDEFDASNLQVVLKTMKKLHTERF